MSKYWVIYDQENDVIFEMPGKELYESHWFIKYPYNLDEFAKKECLWNTISAVFKGRKTMREDHMVFLIDECYSHNLPMGLVKELAYEMTGRKFRSKEVHNSKPYVILGQEDFPDSDETQLSTFDQL